MKLLFADFDIGNIFKKDSVYGGTAFRQFLLAKGLVHFDNNVVLLVYKGDAILIPNVSGICPIETYEPRHGIRYVRWFYYRIPILYRKIKSYRPDVVFLRSSGGTLTLIICLISILLKIKIAILVKADEDVQIWKTTGIKFRNKLIHFFTLKFAKIIICQNDYQFNFFSIKYKKRIVKKIRNPFIIPNDPKPYTGDRKYIACLASFRLVKNYEAVYNFAKQNPHMMFKIAGTYTKVIEPGIKELIEKIKKLQNVELIGHLERENIYNFLSRSICLLNTSFQEGFSNTFLEALASGIPILSLYVNPDEIFTKKKLGFLVDSNSFSMKINELERSFDYIDFHQRALKYLKESHDYLATSEQLSVAIAQL